MDDLQALGLGGAMGFVFKLIGSLVEAQRATVQTILEKQDMADSSADRAAARNGGVIVRRTIVGAILFALILVPFILSFTEQGVTVLEAKNFLFFQWSTWETLAGYVILPEVRQTLLAIVGFYFGSSQIK
tara:strand:- start:4126 stop:4515 length:390 start_codon:yes stop_codon:yes gene_type:complete